MRTLGMIIAFIAALFTSCQPPVEKTEWVIDGVYEPFNTDEQTVAHLMKLAKENDVEKIYQAFSPKTKRNVRNLKEKVVELSDFLNNIVSLKVEPKGVGPISEKFRNGKVFAERIIRVNFYTNETMYQCYIYDIMKDDFNRENQGIYHIAIYPEPEKLDNEYRWLGQKELGIFLMYEGGEYKDDVMEQMVELADKQDSEEIYQLFSDFTKDNVHDLREKAQELTKFLHDKVESWEFYHFIWEKDVIQGENVKKRQMMFLLHTKNEVYRCNIRDLVRQDKENLGIYNITIYPNDLCEQYAILGRDEPGFLHKKLIIRPDNANMHSSGTVTLTTSIEASVTCDNENIELLQVGPLTWKANVPADSATYIFTAVAGEETTSCEVNVWEPFGQKN